jgi:putative ABC transport system permease protein
MSIVPTLEAAARDINKDMPLFQTATMDQVLETSIAQQRLSLIVMVTFAVVALTLASLGLYGVIAHAVTERTHEIGVRMALGAEPRSIQWLILRRALTQLAIGLTLGVAGAFGVGRLLRSMLVQIPTADPPTLTAIVAVLLVVAIAACLWPSRRATRLDPVTALRYE